MISNIINGWGNLIKDKFGLLDNQTKALATKRLQICNDCSLRNVAICDPTRHTINIKSDKLNKFQAQFQIKSGEVARGCGCVIAAKTLDLASYCPAGKW